MGGRRSASAGTWIMLTERAFGPKPSVPFFCVPDLLEHQARRIPDAPAILADGRAPLTYGGLHRHVDAMGRTLRGMGIGRRDRVAVVLPNGPELPVAILGVVASAVCAPVNPAFGTGELERYFADLQLRAVITPAINSRPMITPPTRIDAPTIERGLNATATTQASTSACNVTTIGTLERAVATRFALSGGLADIDKNYGGLNSDRFDVGRRWFTTDTISLGHELALQFFYQHSINNGYALRNSQTFETVLIYNLLNDLRRGHVM